MVTSIQSYCYVTSLLLKGLAVETTNNVGRKQNATINNAQRHVPDQHLVPSIRRCPIGAPGIRTSRAPSWSLCTWSWWGVFPTKSYRGPRSKRYLFRRAWSCQPTRSFCPEMKDKRIFTKSTVWEDCHKWVLFKRVVYFDWFWTDQMNAYMLVQFNWALGMQIYPVGFSSKVGEANIFYIRRLYFYSLKMKIKRTEIKTRHKSGDHNSREKDPRTAQKYKSRN